MGPVRWDPVMPFESWARRMAVLFIAGCGARTELSVIDERAADAPIGFAPLDATSAPEAASNQDAFGSDGLPCSAFHTPDTCPARCGWCLCGGALGRRGFLCGVSNGCSSSEVCPQDAGFF
jgi:hypothetical protein